jgi:hypothetical protein
MSRSRNRTLRRTLAGTAAAIAAVAAPSAALGAPCDAAAAQVFSSYNDSAWYQLAPGGDFETADHGWSVSGTAALVADHDRALGQGPDTSAMELAPGASITSPPVCVTDESPTFRLTANTVRGFRDKTFNIRVEVLYRATRNSPWSVKPYEHVAPQGRSVPTKKFSLAAGQFGLDKQNPSDWTEVMFRVTPINGATVRIDDFYVDPRLR